MGESTGNRNNSLLEISNPQRYMFDAEKKKKHTYQNPDK